MKEIDIGIFALHPLAHTPTFGTEGSAGADLYAIEDQYVPAGEPAKIRTGLAFVIPEGYKMLVHPRSSNLILRNVIEPTLIVDSDYTGEVFVTWYPTKDYAILAGDRVAQVTIEEAIKPRFKVVDRLPETKRGSGGYGSTGR